MNLLLQCNIVIANVFNIEVGQVSLLNACHDFAISFLQRSNSLGSLKSDKTIFLLTGYAIEPSYGSVCFCCVLLTVNRSSSSPLGTLSNVSDSPFFLAGGRIKWREERLSLFLHLLPCAFLIQLLLLHLSHILPRIDRRFLCGFHPEPSDFPVKILSAL